VTFVAAVPPTVTVATVTVDVPTVAKLVPVIAMVVPPAVGPDLGLTPLTVGGLAYVKSVFEALVPPIVVTKTLAVPALPAGVVAVIEFALTTVTFVAAVPPTVTVAPVAKLVPVIVMLVPPAVGPDEGPTSLTVGAAT
jgi:hypothetical protein